MLSYNKIRRHVSVASVTISTVSYQNTKNIQIKVKGKAGPLQAWSVQEGSSKLMFPYFMTTGQDSGKVFSLTHRPPLPSGNIPGTPFC
jgi:hypothetical protein